MLHFTPLADTCYMIPTWPLMSFGGIEQGPTDELLGGPRGPSFDDLSGWQRIGSSETWPFALDIAYSQLRL